MRDYTVMAQTGALGLTSIGSDVSINDGGVVAFQGITSTDQGIFAGDGSTLPVQEINPGFGTGSRHFSQFLQINDSNEIAAQDSVTGPSSLIRSWPASGVGPAEVVAEGSAVLPGYADSAVLLPAINNGNTVLYSDLRNGGNNHEYMETSDGLLFDLGVAPVSVRPQIADDDQVIYRDGNSANSPLKLSDQTIADSTNWSALGQSPGITDDGSFVAFYGDLESASLASALHTTTGPGIFVYQTATGALTRIAGTTPTGFGTFVADSRIAVSDNGTAATVAFLATGSDGKIGIYSIQFNLSEITLPEPDLTQKLVIEQGDMVQGWAFPAENFSLYDPLNKSGQIAFWASDATGAQQAVIRAGTRTFVLAFGVNWSTVPGDNELRGDLGAQKVATAFGKIIGAQNTQEIGASPGQNNIAGLQNAIAHLVDPLNPTHLSAGDTLIFYLGTHGSYQDYDTPPVAGSEVPIEAEYDPNHEQANSPGDDRRKLTTADGEFETGYDAQGQLVSLTDDDFTTFFNTPAWASINKLFLIDSCFSGHAIGAGDLSSLPKSAVITSTKAGDYGYRSNMSGVSFFADAVATATDVIRIQNLDLNYGTLVQWLGNEAQDFANDPARITALTSDWSVTTVGDLDPDEAVGGDFSWNVPSPPVRLPGDADSSGAVDFADLLILAQNYGRVGATWSQGDFDGNGTVNFDDLLLLAQNYGHSIPTGLSASVLLPGDGGSGLAHTLKALTRKSKAGHG